MAYGGGDSTAIRRAVGQTVRLSGRVFRIIGVLPPGFKHVGGTYRTYGHGEPVDVWSVLAPPRGDKPQDRFSHYFNVVGTIRAARVAPRCRKTCGKRR